MPTMHFEHLLLPNRHFYSIKKYFRLNFVVKTNLKVKLLQTKSDK